MKRTGFLIVMTILLLLMVGCGGETSSAPGFGQEDFYLNIDGTRYSCNADIQTVIAGLGEDYDYSEGMSCDYDGFDKTFIYDTVEFYTFPLAEGDMVNEIYTSSPAVSTSKGISVGATKEEVLASYGEDCEDTGYQLLYHLPDSAQGALCFDIEDGVVSAIYITTQPV